MDHIKARELAHAAMKEFNGKVFHGAAWKKLRYDLGFVPQEYMGLHHKMIDKDMLGAQAHIVGFLLRKHGHDDSSEST